MPEAFCGPCIAMSLRVVRVFHAARNREHRGRERALMAAGVEITLVVPAAWPSSDAERRVSSEEFQVLEFAVRRPGDVNRHTYTDDRRIRRLLREIRPDVLDIQAEPYSSAGRQWLLAASAATPVVMYSAQNVDKRFPPPFWWYERAAIARASAFYPCSRQAASVLRGKGFTGRIVTLPLGYDQSLFVAGDQSMADEEIVLALVGRLVPEKGVCEAVRVLAEVNAARPARLLVIGEGPEREPAREVANSLGLGARVEFSPWRTGAELAAEYQRAHIVLILSRATRKWVEQFGRAIVEAQASGAVVAGYASGAIPEVAGASALLAPPGEWRRLADEMTRLLADDREFQTRREAGREFAAGKTWDAVAKRQLGLYEYVAAGGVHKRTLPRSPSRRRAAAHAEFGPPAPLLAGERPFAAPVLRRGGSVAKSLGMAIDGVAELIARSSEG